MSEELIQLGLSRRGIQFNEYEFYPIGKTTINQLKSNRIIPNKDYGSYGILKPDALLVDRRNLNNVNVKAVIEYKHFEEFNTERKKLKACKQCNTYCQTLEADLGIITDTNEYIYINPQIDFENADLEYNDKDIFKNLDKLRGLSYIKREDGYNLINPFILDSNLPDKTKNTLNLIKKISNSINNENSQILRVETQNPSNLARSVWQDVWISKSATPERSLSTFIEIFMFKFLSDLGVLNQNSSGIPISFNDVYGVGRDRCLKYYYDSVRDYIREIFPENPIDNTTLINGISLKPEVREDNQVFYRILKKFEDFGSLKNIDPEFKSRLFEDFLKKSISKKNWGQFFTPRNVVKAIIEMSDIEKLPDGAKVCDPACGVGGFILEPIITKRTNDYFFSGDKLRCKLEYVGFEKGFEAEEKLTITLAKANFIIYLAELLKDNPTLTYEFAEIYNKIFKIYTDTILGSLSQNKENKYDLIMSNPPYVTSGISNYKEAIKEDSQLNSFFKINGTGLEGLFLEKMVRELKKNGTALIIIPDGILNRSIDEKLRRFILDNCIINAIISLPPKTFYTTPKKTYIISLTKKDDQSNIKQTEPVFTYLINDIGETLDANRFIIEENDLKDMVKQYKYFMTNKPDYEPLNLKCKIQPIAKFEDNINYHWSVDRWWTEEEKVRLGIENEEIILSIKEFEDKINDLKEYLGGLEAVLTEEIRNIEIDDDKFIKVSLDDKEIFDLSIGTRVLVEEVRGRDTGVPLYSSNISVIFGYLERSNIEDFSKDYVLWGIDGNFEFSIKTKGEEFATTDHCGTLKIINENIIPEYVLYQLNLVKNKYGFDRSLRASLKNMRKVSIDIPVNDDNEFDKEKQRQIAEKYQNIEGMKKEITNYLEEIQDSKVDIE